MNSFRIAMTPYRFALARILFGLYLIGFFISESMHRNAMISSTIYWGLAGCSTLLFLGYQRQLMSRAVFFFSILLFVFNRSELQLVNSLWILALLILFAIVPGDEPWQVTDSLKESRSPVQLRNGFFSITFGLLIVATIIGLIINTGSILRADGPFTTEQVQYLSWKFYCLVVVLFVLFCPTFLFRPKLKTPRPILFFDGVCGLCNRVVDFVFAEDTHNIYNVAAIQGKTAQEKLSTDLRDYLNTVIVLDSDKLFVRSEAVLNLFYGLGGIWRILFVFRLLPRPLCDLVYNVIAKFRYKIFGKSQTCRLPTSAEKAKFLD